MSWLDSQKEVYCVFIQSNEPWTISEDTAHSLKLASELIYILELVGWLKTLETYLVFFFFLFASFYRCNPSLCVILNILFPLAVILCAHPNHYKIIVNNQAERVKIFCEVTDNSFYIYFQSYVPNFF